jgi:hypothetical protein
LKNLIIALFLIFTININAKGSRANAHGKFTNLKQVITCHKDRAQYGDYYVSGYWKGGKWCGTRAASGYWVWAYPKWYVWANKTNNKSKQKKAKKPSRTSAYGKYYGLKQKMKCSKDRGQYGNYHDSGYWKGGRWCGERGQAGYWVWSNPYWYVWKHRR